MDERTPPEFKSDAYLDRLLVLRDKDPARYRALLPAVAKILEEYEQERKAANLRLMKSDDPGLIARTCPLLERELRRVKG